METVMETGAVSGEEPEARIAGKKADIMIIDDVAEDAEPVEHEFKRPAPTTKAARFVEGGLVEVVTEDLNTTSFKIKKVRAMKGEIILRRV